MGASAGNFFKGTPFCFIADFLRAADGTEQNTEELGGMVPITASGGIAGAGSELCLNAFNVVKSDMRWETGVDAGNE